MARHSGILVVVGVVLVALTGCSSPDPETVPTSSSIPATPAPSTSTTVASTTTTAAAPQLTRPVIEIVGCTPTWARVQSGPVTLFARASGEPIAVQVLASPSGGVTAPYAVVERFFAGQRLGVNPGPDSVDVNGATARVIVGDQGQGEAQWLLADGSEAYVRSRGFEREQLIEILRALQPRPASAPVAGFDLAAPAPLGLDLVGEAMDPAGEITATSCALAGGGSLNAFFLRGDPAFQYSVALDASPLPVVGEVDGAVVAVAGPPMEAQAALMSFVQATPEQWDAMLAMTGSAG